MSARRARSARGLIAVVFVAAGTIGSGRSMDPGPGAFAAVGAQAERGYFSQVPFERVDMVNGNLTLSFTDFSLPGNAGMDLRITRTYNHQLATGYKWTFGFGGVPLRILHPEEVEPPSLLMSDGTSQPLHWNIVSGVWLTTDFWRYTASTRTLQLPNGWVATYGSDGWARLISVTDQFGNTITPDWEEYATGFWRLDSVAQSVSDASQSRTRTVEFDYQNSTHPTLPTTIEYDGKTWTYTYSSVGLITSAQPPAGPDWEFAYNLSSNEGTLTVTTPTGGTVEYELTPAVEEITTGGRAVTGDSWELDYDVEGSTATSSVTMPSGRRLEFTHLHRAGPNGFEWTLEERKLFMGQTQLASVSREYEAIAFGNASVWVVDEQTIAQDGVTFTTDFDYSSSNFGDYRQPNEIAESASNHSLTRVTTRTFTGFSSYILPKVDATTVAVGSESHTSTATYNSVTGAITSSTAFGITTSFGVDGFGNTATVTDAHNHQTTATFQWGVPQQVQTPEYTITRSINADGSVASETRAGRTTTFEYDDLVRVTTMTPPVGATVQTSFASDGSSTTVIRGSSWVSTTVDGFGRPVVTENASGTKTTAQFDAEGFKTFQSAPFTGSAGTGNTFAYDGLGRLASITHADSSDVTYTYSGTTVTITDENNHSTTHNYQMFGRPGGGRLVGLTDADAQAWAYSYNAAGSLTLVDSPSGPNRVWTYNSHNQLTSETQPESGTTTFTYDAAGLPASRTDARGVTMTYVHDANHRLRHIVSPLSAETVTFEYDAADNQTRLLTGGLESLFTYDSGNRLSGRIDLINGQSFSTAYEYDTRDNLTKITYPSGRLAQYLYDDANRITKVYAGATTYAEDLTYHATGALASAEFGNGKTESMTLNSRFRPEHLVSGPLDVTYAYDAAGNVTSINDDRSGKDSTFTYDNLDRLTGVTGFGSTTFSYDALGNRATKGSGQSTVTYAYSSSTNRLTSATSGLGVPETGTFTYDDAGNMTGDGTGTYAYSSHGLMKTATLAGATTAYAYDAAGQRAIKTAPGSVRYYVRGLGALVLAEYDATSGVPKLAKEYIYLGSKLLASFSETITTPSVSTQLTAPVAGTITPSDAGVALTATAAITGGGSISSVQFYANGLLVASDTSAPYEGTWTPTTAGTYTVTSRAVASTGKVANSVPAAVTVTATGRVLGLTTSPTSPVAGQLTTVTVTGNSYTCGAVLVNFGDGSSNTYPLSQPLASAPLHVTHTWATAGSKTITATGQSTCLGSPSHGITVVGNTAPTVSLTAPSHQSLHTTGAAISLTASASDSDGSVASVEFYDGSTLLHTDTAAPWSYSWTTASEGAHTVKARAIDNYGMASTESSISLTVQDVQSVAVSPSTPVVGQAAVVTVYGSATGCGAVQVNYGDGTVITYAIDGLPISNYHTWTTGGQKTVTATGQGNCSGTAQTSATPNAAPTVSLTTPANSDFFPSPATVSMTATASDSDGSIASVKFYAGSTLLETDTSAPYSYSWSGMSNGSYSITAVATDNQGATTTSSAAGISVNTPPASTVTGVSLSVSTVGVNTSVTVTVTGGNPCGAVQINFGDGEAPYLPIEELPYQTTHSWSTAGTYTITASGQGNCGGQSSTQLTVTSESPQAQARLEPGLIPRERRGRDRSVRADITAVELEGEAIVNSEFVESGAAAIAPVTVTLDLLPGASGTVTSAPSGFNCSGQDTTCPASFEAGTSVTLTATPSTGNVFLGWGGACSGTSSCVITAASGQLVTAAFAAASSGTITYYHTDLLGSVRVLTDAAGDTITRHDYFAFGESSSDLGGDPRRFLGQERDAETAMDQLGARYYRNVWGRFTAVDPIFTTALIDPQRWNRYAYALNNPLRYTDPTGLDAEVDEDSFEEGSSHIGFFGDNLDDFAEFYEHASTSHSYETWLALDRPSVAAQEKAAKVAAEAAAQAAALAKAIAASVDRSIGQAWVALVRTFVYGDPTLGDALTIATMGIPTLRTGGSAVTFGITAGTSTLVQANKAATIAAANAYTFKVGLKHTAGAGGKYSKFAHGVDPNALLREGLMSPNGMFRPNDTTSFKFVVDFGRAIGSKGETSMRAVVDFNGTVVTWFPVR